MQRASLDFGEQFANLTCMIEDAHSIAIQGQAHGLASDERKVLVSQLHRAISGMRECVTKIDRAL